MALHFQNAIGCFKPSKGESKPPWLPYPRAQNVSKTTVEWKTFISFGTFIFERKLNWKIASFWQIFKNQVKNNIFLQFPVLAFYWMFQLLFLNI